MPPMSIKYLPAGECPKCRQNLKRRPPTTVPEDRTGWARNADSGQWQHSDVGPGGAEREVSACLCERCGIVLGLLG